MSTGVFRTSVDVRVPSSDGHPRPSLCTYTVEEGVHFRGFKTEASLAPALRGGTAPGRTNDMDLRLLTTKQV